MRIARYRTVRRLGAGGTASVYEAVDDAGAHVALKLLHPHLAGDPGRWDAFFEEVRASSAVDHPAIAAILDWGVQRGADPTVWIAMELVRGRTLAAHVADAGPLPVAEAVTVADVLLDALASAHAAGVVHRDVSPANVMLDTDPDTGAVDPASVRLLDFGLADIPGRSTRGGDALLSAPGGDGVVANVRYASPEHLSGASVVEASDVYQAAATLWFALTGAPVFAGTTDEVVRAHLGATPPRLSSVRADVPAALDRVLAHALRKHPADRYDATGMRIALREALADAAATDAANGAGVTERIPLLPPLATDDISGHTAVYRTSVETPAAGGMNPAHLAPRRRGRFAQGWVVAGAGAAAIAVIVALAASARPTSVTPTAAASTVPSPTASATTASPAAVQLVAVPELVGLSRGEAIAALGRVGLRVGPVDAVDAAVAADTVTDTLPATGASVALGTAVALTVGSGNNVVPDVAGLDVGSATVRLAAAGFVASIEPAASDAASGTVLSVAPQGSRPLGSPVVLRVSRGSATASPTPTPTTTSTPTPTATPSPGPTGGAR
ncbi:protein kinase [Microbacterium sp. X-17]|uniref:serine/threonine protein kinase n=1 Tax=Microbacterium sp. X-17 TaxID=3144404 RepID=UPI0031F5571D